MANPVRGFPANIGQLGPQVPGPQNRTFAQAQLRVDEVTKAFNICVICDGEIRANGPYRQDGRVTDHGRVHDHAICILKMDDQYFCGACHTLIPGDYTLHGRLGMIHDNPECRQLADRIIMLLDPQNDAHEHNAFRQDHEIALGANRKDYILRQPIFERDADSGKVCPGIKIEDHQKKHAEKWIGVGGHRPGGTTLFQRDWQKDDYVSFFNQVVNSEPMRAVVRRVPLRVDTNAGARIQPDIVVNLQDNGIPQFKFQKIGSQELEICEAVRVQLAYGGYNRDGQFVWNLHMYPNDPNRRLPAEQQA